MRLHLVIITLLLLGLSALPAEADTAERAKNVIREFSKAQSAGDEKATSKLYDQVMSDRKLYNEVRKNHKNIYALIKLEGTDRKIRKMQRRYGSREIRYLQKKPKSVLSTVDSGTTSSTGGKSRRMSNRKFSQNFANQRRDPNRVRRSLSNSRVRATNNDTSRSFSNRMRTRTQSNQRRLRQGR